MLRIIGRSLLGEVWCGWRRGRGQADDVTFLIRKRRGPLPSIAGALHGEAGLQGNDIT